MPDTRRKKTDTIRGNEHTKMPAYNAGEMDGEMDGEIDGEIDGEKDEEKDGDRWRGESPEYRREQDRHRKQGTGNKKSPALRENGGFFYLRFVI